jgi:antitoxin component of RelBE/YafQ-DinJ toxin-antitoxin module
MDKLKKINDINIRIEPNIKLEFINHCDSNGYTISKRIRLLIERDLKGKLIIND